jgi:hypothetical protein
MIKGIPGAGTAKIIDRGVTRAGVQEMLAITAYHEAGHAVRTWWLRRLIDEVRIDRDHPGDGWCGGQLWSRVLVRSGGPVRWSSIEEDVSVKFAGPLAEARYRRLRLRGPLAPQGCEDVAWAWEVVTLWS